MIDPPNPGSLKRERNSNRAAGALQGGEVSGRRRAAAVRGRTRASFPSNKTAGAGAGTGGPVGKKSVPRPFRGGTILWTFAVRARSDLMAEQKLGHFLGQVRRVLEPPAADTVADRQLLESFVEIGRAHV